MTKDCKNLNKTYKRDYVTGCEYKDGNLEFIRTSEGKVVNGTSTFDYVYNLKDHLGSTRVILNDNAQVVEEYDYDAFGNIMTANVTVGTPYQYTGQEYDDETELHNFRARFYDSDLMRFYAVDPEEQFASPYLYCGNNPIRYIDQSGKSAWEVDSEWDSDTEEEFSLYIINNWDIDQTSNTCDDYVLKLVLNFAMERGLPVKIENESGVFDNRSQNYDNSEDFVKDVLDSTNASDLENPLFSNTIYVDSKKIRSGDLFFSRDDTDLSANHAQVIIGSDNDFVWIAQGNMRFPKLSRNIQEGRTKLFPLSRSRTDSPLYSGVQTQVGLWNTNNGNYRNFATGKRVTNLFDNDNFIAKRWNTRRWN